MGDSQTVTIPLAEYRALMEDRADLARVRGLTGGGVLCVSPCARFRGDPEVVAFLNEHATTVTVECERSVSPTWTRRYGCWTVGPTMTGRELADGVSEF